MKKQLLKKSDVLREGYVKGLKEAQRIINEQIKGYVLNENPVIPRFSIEDEQKKEKKEKAKKEVLDWYNTNDYFDEINDVIGHYRKNYWSVIKDVLLNYDRYDIYITEAYDGHIRLCVKDNSKGRDMRLHWIDLHDNKDEKITIASCGVLMCDFFSKDVKEKMYEKVMNVIERHNGANKFFKFSKEKLYRMVDKSFTDIGDDFWMSINMCFSPKKTNDGIRHLIKKIWEAQGRREALYER